MNQLITLKGQLIASCSSESFMKEASLPKAKNLP